MEVQVFDDGYKPTAKHARPKAIKYVATNGGCWECVSHARTEDGYAVLKRNGKHQRMHRYIYKLVNGIIPEGMEVMHTCDNPPCFNPDHLKVGTTQDNIYDKVSKNRHPHGTTNGRAELTVEDVLKIRSDPRSSNEIAKDYPVGGSAIRRIKQGKTWRHI